MVLKILGLVIVCILLIKNNYLLYCMDETPRLQVTATVGDTQISGTATPSTITVRNNTIHLNLLNTLAAGIGTGTALIGLSKVVGSVPPQGRAAVAVTGMFLGAGTSLITTIYNSRTAPTPVALRQESSSNEPNDIVNMSLIDLEWLNLPTDPTNQISFTGIQITGTLQYVVLGLIIIQFNTQFVERIKKQYLTADKNQSNGGTTKFQNILLRIVTSWSKTSVFIGILLWIYQIYGLCLLGFLFYILPYRI